MCVCVWGGAYMRGAYTWSNTSVKETVGLPAGAIHEAVCWELRQRNTVNSKS